MHTHTHTQYIINTVINIVVDASHKTKTYLSNILDERTVVLSIRPEDRHPRLDTKQVQHSQSSSI